MKDEKKVSLKVDGMTCGSCVRHVTEALRDLEGVCDVTVSLRQRTAKVRYEAESVSEAKLITALEEAGYGARRCDGPAREARNPGSGQPPPCR
jgi:copper chaperone